MLYVDIASTRRESIRVGAIGTCRVRDILTDTATPVDDIEDNAFSFSSKKVWRGFSAFVHTTYQAEQYYKIFNSDIEIPELIEPLIYNRHLDDITRSKIIKAGRELGSTVDAYVVELSTLNTFEWKNYFFNQNYFERNMVK